MTTQPAHHADDAQPCPNAGHMGEHACTNKAQCWEPCGDLGKSMEHVVVVSDDEAEAIKSSQTHFADNAPLAKIAELEQKLQTANMNTEVWRRDAEGKLQDRTEAYHKIASLESQLAAANEARQKAEKFIEQAFVAHPNIDLDIAAIAQGKEKT